MCERCPSEKPSIGQRVLEAAARRGGACLSEGVEGAKTRTPLRSRCSEGHEWEATAGNLARGSWCPTCAGHAPLTDADLEALARGRGGRFLGFEASPENAERGRSDKKGLWECSKEHRWAARISNVRHRASWCPACAAEKARAVALSGKAAPWTLERYKELALGRGGSCLSDMALRRDAPMSWRCAEGHEFEASGNAVQHGAWCYLCGTRHRRVMALAAELARAAWERGGRLLVAARSAHAKATMECAEGHRWEGLAGNLLHGSWCPACAGQARITVERCEAAAGALGGYFLGETAPKSHELAPWLCSEGHAWSAAPCHVFRGHWCPACQGRKKWNPVSEAAERRAALLAPPAGLDCSWDDPSLEQMIAAARAAMAALEADARATKAAAGAAREFLVGEVSMIDSVSGEGLILTDEGKKIAFSMSCMSRSCWDEIEIGSKVKFRLDASGTEAARAALAD